MSTNITVNFKKQTGKLKPLNGVCNAPYNYGSGPMQDNLVQLFQEGNIPYCRLHDCEGKYGGTYFIDVPNIFRNFDADENDPSNYDFHYSDEYMAGIIASGCQVYYRLGVTIEWGSKKYRINPPKDFAKWARICEHIIMHYNHGWANGFEYNIRYWEIWNEPENPGNINGKCMWNGTDEEFFDLYEIVSKYLKEKFPELKFGGYGGCGFYAVTREKDNPSYNYFVEFFEKFLKMVKERNCPFDFYSWHIYSMSETELLAHARYVRETLDAYGFQNTESHLNEWNIADEGTGFKNKHTMEGGSFLVAVMCMLQNTNYVDKAMYYCFSKRGMYVGFIDQNDSTMSPAWYPFAAYGKITALEQAVDVACDGDGIYAVAAMTQQKRRIMISNYRSEDDEVIVRVKADDDIMQAYITTIDEDFAGEYNRKKTTKLTEHALRIRVPKHVVVYLEICEDNGSQVSSY